MFPLYEIHVKDCGFLVNNELEIRCNTGNFNISRNNGFQLLPSQAKSVRRMFERHPEIASEFRPKNKNLRIAYMSFILSLIETMCQSPQELSKDDMSSAYVALEFMTKAGFKMDWLEKKLDEVTQKKEKEQVGETKLQGMEEKLKDLKQMCSDMEALLEKEKGEVSAAKTPLTFDDIV